MDIDVAAVRVFLHLLGVVVWVGGQIVMAALVPALRSLGADAPRQVARRFGMVAWPFFALAIGTGIWNLFAINVGEQDATYNMSLGIKLLLVALSGVAAFLHQMAGNKATRAITGALAAVTAMAALFFGAVLTT